MNIEGKQNYSKEIKKKNVGKQKHIWRKAKIFEGKQKKNYWTKAIKNIWRTAKNIWRKAKKNIWRKAIKNIWRKIKNIWMNIEGKQKYLKESKKNCRKAKTFEGKQNYLKES